MQGSEKPPKRHSRFNVPRSTLATHQIAYESHLWRELVMVMVHEAAIRRTAPGTNTTRSCRGKVIRRKRKTNMDSITQNGLTGRQLGHYVTELVRSRSRSWLLHEITYEFGYLLDPWATEDAASGQSLGWHPTSRQPHCEHA